MPIGVDAEDIARRVKADVYDERNAMNKDGGLDLQDLNKKDCI